MHIFKQFDMDNSGWLEEKECEHVVKRAGLSKEDFDWKQFDSDKDGKLSVLEFLEAGPVVGEKAAQQAASLMEEDEGEGEGEFDENMEDEDEDDASLLMEDDEDGDGTNEYESDSDDDDEKEDEGFSDVTEDEDGESGDQEFSVAVSAQADARISKLFKQLDKNNDKSLEPEEILKVISKLKEEQRLPAKFDKDHSMSLSESEFKEMCKYLIKKKPREVMQLAQSFSLAEDGSEASSEDDGDEEGDHEGKEDDHSEYDSGDEKDEDGDRDMSKHFHEADANNSGHLEAQEMDKLLAKMNMKGFDWKSLDSDHDGKLSLEEFEQAMQE